MKLILKRLRDKNKNIEMIKVPDSIRKKLKEPLPVGKLVSFKSFLKLLSKLKSPKLKSPKLKISKLKNLGNRILIAVGDVTGKKLVDKRIEPDIWIYDRKEMRKKVKWKTPFPTHLVKNPRGTITRNLMAAIKDAVSIGKRSKSKIFVKGEEDLSVLPAIEIAPIGTIIVYGQPKKGVVFIEVNKQAKSFVKSILSYSFRL